MGWSPKGSRSPALVPGSRPTLKLTEGGSALNCIWPLTAGQNNGYCPATVRRIPNRYPHRPTRLRRSSLKERGRVKTLVTTDLGCLRPRRTRRHGRRGQGSGGARPRSGRRALRSAPGSTNNMGGGDSSGGRFLTGEKCFRAVRSSGPGVPAWGAGPGGLPVIPSPRQGRHDGVRGASGRRGQSDGATTPGLGVMTCTTRADQGKAEGGVHAASGWCSRARTWPSRSA